MLLANYVFDLLIYQFVIGPIFCWLFPWLLCCCYCCFYYYLNHVPIKEMKEKRSLCMSCHGAFLCNKRLLLDRIKVQCSYLRSRRRIRFIEYWPYLWFCFLPPWKLSWVIVIFKPKLFGRFFSTWFICI